MNFPLTIDRCESGLGLWQRAQEGFSCLCQSVKNRWTLAAKAFQERLEWERMPLAQCDAVATTEGKRVGYLLPLDGNSCIGLSEGQYRLENVDGTGPKFVATSNGFEEGCWHIGRYSVQVRTGEGAQAREYATNELVRLKDQRFVLKLLGTRE